MAYRPSPASIPLPLSNPLSPAVPFQEVDARPQTLIDLLPSNVRDLQDLGRVDLELLRRAMDDDGASSVTGRSVAEDDEDIAAQQSQEVPIASSTVPTGDSLYQALRSPSPETVPVASTSAQPAEQQDLITLADPITESSGELTRLMARYPMIITGPGSAPHKVVRTMSHESFMSNLHRASISPSEVLRQESEMASSSGGKGKSVARSGSDQAGLPSSTSKYSDEGNPAPAEFSEESVRKGGSTSIASIASTQRKLSPPSRTPTETPSLVASPSDSTASPSRPRRPDDSGWNFAEPALSTPERLSRDSTVSPRNAKLSVSLAPVPSTSYSSVSTSLYAELQAAEVRNEREREALEREMKQARMEADDLERQCEELSQMLQSLGLQPVSIPDVDASFRSAERARSPKEQSRSPRISRPVASPLKRDPAPQTRSVSYHQINGDHGHRRRPPEREELLRSDLPSHEALERVARALSLPISALDGAPSGTAHSPNPFEPRSLDDVARAMDFLRSADSLIWKGRRETGRMSGRAGDSIFAEENVQALRERLGMWERVVRSKR